MSAAYRIHSMTGYARALVPSPWGQMQLELRTINHRYLDISIRLPEELRAFETPLRGRLTAGIGRGKVEAGLRIIPDPKNPAALQLDPAVIESLGQAIAELELKLDRKLAADAPTLLRWQGVIREPELDQDTMATQVEALADAALAELENARLSEGQRLAVLIAERLDQVDALVAAVTERLPLQQAAWRERFEQRLAELADLEPERRDQAVVQFLQKLDVDEELSRLGSHCSEVRKCLEAAGPIGRKLDFFMQELNREANTLGSKSMDAEITRIVVDLKVLIEQMREQVQNIE